MRIDVLKRVIFSLLLLNIILLTLVYYLSKNKITIILQNNTAFSVNLNEKEFRDFLVKIFNGKTPTDVSRIFIIIQSSYSNLSVKFKIKEEYYMGYSYIKNPDELYLYVYSKKENSVDQIEDNLNFSLIGALLSYRFEREIPYPRLQEKIRQEYFSHKKPFLVIINYDKP